MHPQASTPLTSQPSCWRFPTSNPVLPSHIAHEYLIPHKIKITPVNGILHVAQYQILVHLSRAKKTIGWASLHTPTRSSCREISHPGRIATVEILHSFNETRFELCRTTVDGSEGKLRSAAEFATMRSVSSKRIPKAPHCFFLCVVLFEGGEKKWVSLRSP